MSNLTIEPPPKQEGLGCFGKGCLLFCAFFVLLLIFFVIGLYFGTKPKEIPKVVVTEQQQNEVKARWDEFEAASQNEQIETPATPAPVSTPAAAAAEETPIPTATPINPNRIELTASDINALISRGRHTRGHGFVSIDDDVAHVQINVPLDKMGFRGRSINGSFAVRSSSDHSPRNLQISQVSFAGMPDAMVNSLIGAYPVQGYVDDFVNKYGITSATIANGKLILETRGPIPR